MSKRITITLDEMLVEIIDELAGEGRRSAFVREALLDKIKVQTGHPFSDTMRPPGVRRDRRPAGWRSAAEENRYHFTAYWDRAAEQFQVTHSHLAPSLPGQKRREMIEHETLYPFRLEVYAPPGVSRKELREAVKDRFKAVRRHLFDRDDTGSQDG